MFNSGFDYCPSFTIKTKADKSDLVESIRLLLLFTFHSSHCQYTLPSKDLSVALSSSSTR